MALSKPLPVVAVVVAVLDLIVLGAQIKVPQVMLELPMGEMGKTRVVTVVAVVAVAADLWAAPADLLLEATMVLSVVKMAIV
jgi:hypothetical protein